jgi:hypothetical protein
MTYFVVGKFTILRLVMKCQNSPGSDSPTALAQAY